MTSRATDLVHELLDQGQLDQAAVDKARQRVKDQGEPLDQALVESEAISEAELVRFIGDRFQVPVVDLEQVPVDTELLSLMPERTARRYLALPLYRKGHAIVVAMAEAWNVPSVDEVRFSLGRSIRPVLAPRSALRAKIDELFAATEQAGAADEEAQELDVLENALSEMDDLGFQEEEGEDESAQKLLQESSASPIVKIVNDVLIRAIHKGASDIHIEPQETAVVVRFRVDGALREEMRIPSKAQNAITSRIKVLADMDISISRKPQDGRIKLHYRDKPLDLRVSTLPTYWGEKVVMRILDQSGVGLELSKLGFQKAEEAKLEEIMAQPQGMLLVTGPTGSGKTTTLYSVLSAINQVEINIITVEDPVEYQLPQINQVPVNPKAGMTFAAGLRSILRQDPNVIMVGEIRDHETAEIALESAETGHMVFSTLHTNSAAGAITRFLDMDIPSYLLASSLSGVLAQRLLRRNCPDCRAPVDVGEGFRTKYNIPADVTFYEGQGCTTCDGTGTKGRIGAYELLVADRDIQEAIHDRDAEANLVDRARRGGMHLMFEDGLIKAMKGHVAPAEILRSLDLPSGVEIDGGRLLDSADATWEERRRGTHAGTETGGEGGEGLRQALVVSDESAQRAMTVHLLEEAGMVATQLDSGRKALDSVHHQRPGLVVADVASPDLDGVALAESLRREPDLGRIPIVLIAEAYSARQEATALDAGADDYLVKPVDPERLLARIRRLFRIYGTDEEAPRAATGVAS